MHKVDLELVSSQVSDFRFQPQTGSGRFSQIPSIMLASENYLYEYFKEYIPGHEWSNSSLAEFG